MKTNLNVTRCEDVKMECIGPRLHRKVGICI